MNRRRFLQVLAAAVAAGGGVLAGWTVPALVRLRGVATRTVRVPSDLMARLRGRTRPLDPDVLERPHDLAG